jgi:diacylglycerol kinase family enzyme
VGQEDAKNALLKLKPLDGKQAEGSETVAAPSTQAEPPPADNSQAESRVEPGSAAPPASVTVKSTPPGADINVDGKFMGSTPSTIQLVPGEHQVSVEKEGLRPWQRTMTVSAGGSLTIDATLEKP